MAAWRHTDAQGLDAGCLDKTPVLTGDAKMVEACCKLAVQAATRTAEGGRSHLQRSGMASEATWQRRTASGPSWPYAGAAGGREPTDRQPRRTSIALVGRRRPTDFCFTCHSRIKLSSCLTFHSTALFCDMSTCAVTNQVHFRCACLIAFLTDTS